MIYMNDDTVSGNSIHDLKWYETYVPYCKGHVLWAVGHNHLNRVIHIHDMYLVDLVSRVHSTVALLYCVLYSMYSGTVPGTMIYIPFRDTGEIPYKMP